MMWIYNSRFLARNNSCIRDLRSLIATTTTAVHATVQPNSRNFSSIDQEEMERFSRLSDIWWDPQGKYSLLHLMNPLRVNYVKNTILQCHSRGELYPRPLEGLKILDVGCGGGLLSESLARLGAKVTAIDAEPSTVEIAKQHGQQDVQIRENITYVCGDIQDIEEAFDAVCALEVVEHVANQPSFISQCTSLLNPGGALLVSTINRTPAAYAFTILTAENILGWVPKGTHHYEKYVTPGELKTMIEKNKNMSVIHSSGLFYNPLTSHWSFCESLAMNYIMASKKM